MSLAAKGSRTKEGMVDVPGGKVWYKIVGARAKGNPVLTLHGGPGYPHDYLEPLEDLSNDRPVIFYDQLGCGNSDKPNDTSLWTVDRFVEELAVLRESLELDKVHLLGHSWGTILAVEYVSTRKPRGICSMVLSGPALSASRWTSDCRAYLAKLPKDTQKAILDSEAAGTFDSPEYQAAVLTFYKKHVCRLDPWPDCVSRTVQKLGKPVLLHMWGPSEFTATGTLKDFELTGLLKEISVPVLFTAAQYDEASPKTTRYYHSLLPGSEIHVFKGASHCHHVEKREEYVQVVRDFLARADSRNE
jgi:proline iminopeptidase